jgi:hypothetical protein
MCLHVLLLESMYVFCHIVRTVRNKTLHKINSYIEVCSLALSFTENQEDLRAMGTENLSPFRLVT